MEQLFSTAKTGSKFFEKFKSADLRRPKYWMCKANMMGRDVDKRIIKQKTKIQWIRCIYARIGELSSKQFSLILLFYLFIYGGGCHSLLPCAPFKACDIHYSTFPYNKEAKLLRSRKKATLVRKWLNDTTLSNGFYLFLYDNRSLCCLRYRDSTLAVAAIMIVSDNLSLFFQTITLVLIACGRDSFIQNTINQPCQMSSFFLPLFCCPLTFLTRIDFMKQTRHVGGKCLAVFNLLLFSLDFCCFFRGLWKLISTCFHFPTFTLFLPTYSPSSFLRARTTLSISENCRKANGCAEGGFLISICCQNLNRTTVWTLLYCYTIYYLWHTQFPLMPSKQDLFIIFYIFIKDNSWWMSSKATALLFTMNPKEVITILVIRVTRILSLHWVRIFKSI